MKYRRKGRGEGRGRGTSQPEPTTQWIVCNKGCPPDLTNITKNPRTLIWTFFPEGQGAIKNVTGLQPPLFQNGQQVGAEYTIEYTGDPGDEKLFSYGLTSDPECIPDPDAEEAQLTNGPG